VDLIRLDLSVKQIMAGLQPLWKYGDLRQTSMAVLRRKQNRVLRGYRLATLPVGVSIQKVFKVPI